MTPARVLLDTNIVSYLMRGNREAKAYSRHVENRLLAISFITVGELYFGAEQAKWGDTKRRALEATLRQFVVVPYDKETAACYGRLVAERQRGGRPISLNDAWIAACAVRFGIPLVTHNARDFSGISDLQVITEPIPSNNG